MRKICITCKTDRSKLSDNFYAQELSCKCDSTLCFYTLYSKELLAFLELSRRLLGSKPLYLSSGFRCQTHNKDENGVSNSKHCYGLAADIICPSDMEYKEFIRILKHEVRWPVVIEYKEGFAHCSLNF